MLSFMLRRLLYMIPTLFLITIVAFVIISLPPGDYLTTLIAQMRAQGGEVDQARIAALRAAVRTRLADLRAVPQVDQRRSCTATSASPSSSTARSPRCWSSGCR